MTKELTFWIVFILTLPALAAGWFLCVGMTAFRSGRGLGTDFINWVNNK